MTAPEQLPLRFHPTRDKTFECFLPGDNAAVVGCLRHLCATHGAEQTCLWGAAASGKSHLLHAVCCKVAQDGGRSAFLPLNALVESEVEILDGLEAVDMVCIDDLDAAAGNADWEEALFHLVNRALANRCKLVMASRDNPTHIAFSLPDLASRVVWGGVYRLSPLDDSDKATAIGLHARERGCTLPGEVVRYLLNHHPRDMNSLVAAVQRIDHASLREQRRITVPFAKSILADI